MGNSIKKIIITTVTVAAGALAAPVVPSEMTLQYSFSTNNPSAFVLHDELASTTIPLDLQYKDVDKDGIVYFSVFADKQGNDVYVEIPKEKYDDMGKAGGYAHNPKKNEYSTLFDSLVTTAEAAVTGDATTSPSSGGTDGSYTSVTFSHTTGSGSNRVMVIGLSAFGASDITASSSVTYNGVSATHYISKMQGSYVGAYIYYLANPTSGANNVVVTFNTTLSQYSAGAITVAGATTPLTGGITLGGTGTADPSVNVTSATGDLVFDVVGEQLKTATLGPVGAGQRQQWLNTGAGRRDGGASTETGASSVTMSWTDGSSAGENWVQAAANIPAFVAPVVTPNKNIILFE